MGFLSELLDKKGMKALIQFAKGKVKEAYNPFDPLGLDSGSFIAGWQLRLNVPAKKYWTLLSKQY